MENMVNVREANNWRIYKLYINKEHTECLDLIEESLRICNGVSEFPFFIKGKTIKVYDSFNYEKQRKN